MEREPESHPVAESQSAAARSADAEEASARSADPRHQCEAYGQVYDMRDLGLVLHHLQRGHAPRPLN